MLYYAAPMEGITTYIYRKAHARWYGGVDKYFTPFIASRKITPRERRDILPENNTGLVLVPQILTNKAEDFLNIAGRLASYGYDTVNLNLGCPSGTVTARKRGAGFLSDPDALDAFLYEIYEKCPLKISVKTRLGVSDLKEWASLLDIYARYPIQELIVHTRLLQEFYTGSTHPEAYAEAMDKLCSAGIPLCYNGDIVSRESLFKTVHTVMKNRARPACGILPVPANCHAAGQPQICGTPLNTVNNIPAADRISDIDKIHCPYTGIASESTPDAAFSEMNDISDRIMIGRGLLKNPALAKQLKQSGRDSKDVNAEAQPDPETLRAFHDEILDGYCQIMSGDLPVLFKMKDLWTYMISAFAEADSMNSGLTDTYTSFRSASVFSDQKDPGKYLKRIRKADRLSEYKIAVDSLFREYDEYAPSGTISPA